MSWQRDDDGAQVYESDSLWRAVVFSAAGPFGVYLEHPNKKTIQSRFTFHSVEAARDWCMATLAMLDPASFKAKPPPSTPPRFSRCPLCSKEVPPGHLDEHMAAQHASRQPAQPLARRRQVSRVVSRSSVRKKAVPPLLPLPLTEATRNCPICNKHFQTFNALGQHLRDKHHQAVDTTQTSTSAVTRQVRQASSPVTAKQAAPPKTKAGANSKRQCPLCQQLVQQADLSKHLQEVHGRRLKQAECHSRNESPIRGTAYSNEISLEALEQSFEDRRDASRGWGHHRRDYDGTWGSMPVHDDYGDESSAY